MLTVRYTIRQIADADLPTVRSLDGTRRRATLAELRDLGIVPHGGGYYACAERHAGTLVPDATASGGVARAYQPHGLAFPGTIVAHGSPAQRAAMLPDAAKPFVLHAHVFRGTRGDSARALCTAHAAPAAITPDALIAAGHALAAAPNPVVGAVLVPMGEIAPEADVVIRTNILAHHWHGERAPQRAPVAPDPAARAMPLGDA